MLQRMRELGAGDRDCLGTERWVRSFLRDCQAQGASAEREAGLRWLRSRKPSPGDSTLLWRWEPRKMLRVIQGGPYDCGGSDAFPECA